MFERPDNYNSEIKNQFLFLLFECLIRERLLDKSFVGLLPFWHAYWNCDQTFRNAPSDRNFNAITKENLYGELLIFYNEDMTVTLIEKRDYIFAYKEMTFAYTLNVQSIP